MDTSNNSGNIEKESIELVLEEFAEDQKSYHKTVGDLVTAVNGLTDRLKQIEVKLANPPGITVSADTKPIQEIVKKGLVDTRLIVAGQPKNIVRKFQILLFPEQDAKLFYKVVFGRWFLWLTIMLLLTNLYKFSIHLSDNKKEVQIRQEENNKINKAWNYLYTQSSKGIKKLMDSAYVKSQYLTE